MKSSTNDYRNPMSFNRFLMRMSSIALSTTERQKFVSGGYDRKQMAEFKLGAYI